MQKDNASGAGNTDNAANADSVDKEDNTAVLNREIIKQEIFSTV